MAKSSPVSDCRKTYITKRVVRPTPINPQKAATCAWLFALLKGGAPRWSGGRTAILSLVRWPDGHTFFAFLRTTGPARERSMGAEALRQPLAKTRKSGLSHFFDTLKGKAQNALSLFDFVICSGFGRRWEPIPPRAWCNWGRSGRRRLSALFLLLPSPEWGKWRCSL